MLDDIDLSKASNNQRQLWATAKSIENILVHADAIEKRVSTTLRETENLSADLKSSLFDELDDLRHKCMVARVELGEREKDMLKRDDREALHVAVNQLEARDAMRDLAIAVLYDAAALFPKNVELQESITGWLQKLGAPLARREQPSENLALMAARVQPTG